MRTDKYLTELGIEPKNQWLENSYRPWYHCIQQKIKVWFDRRKHMVSYVDTYNFDDTMCKYLYAGLRRYIDMSKEYIVLDDKNFKVEWQGQEYTQLEMINMILERLEFYYHLDDYLPEWNNNYKTIYDLPDGFYDEYREKEKQAYEGINEAWQMWALIWNGCWW